MTRPRSRQLAAELLLLLAPCATACSLRGMAINSVADAMSASGETFASDEDPELIRHATPFALKTMESILEQRPRHRGLLLALASGFTQYAYAFPGTDALLWEAEDPDRAEAARQRALQLYLRAREYGLRGLELRRPGVSAELRTEPESTVTAFRREDVPLLYWTAAAWGAAISTAPDDPELTADFPAVRALFGRAFELEPTYEEGALHEAMISLESVPAAMGGSRDRARQHFEQAIALSGGRKAGPYVALAVGVSVPEQNRAEFETLLKTALAVDPDAVPRLRLANLIMQRRARYLLGRVDHLFLESEPQGSHGPGAGGAANSESQERRP